MKRLLYLLLLAIPFVSCEDTETNSPAMQGSIEDVLFQANDARATRQFATGGALLIEGLNEDERLVIRVPKPGSDLYDVSVNRTAYATYVNEVGQIYSTFPFGVGEINMTRFNTTGEDRITGTFKFTAIQDGLDTLYIERGIYFDVPIIEGIEIDDPTRLILKKYGTLTANINGEFFKPQNVQGEEVGGSIIVITGIADSGAEMRLQFTDFVEDGQTYPFVDSRYSAWYKPRGEQEERQMGGSVTIDKIWSNRRQVTGTFQFVTENYEVIEGTFFSNF